MVRKMKKFSDVITVVSFFIILVMFAVSTLFFQHSQSFSGIYERTGNIKKAVTKYVKGNFPLSSNWHKMYASILVGSGRDQFGDVYLAKDRLLKISEEADEADINENITCINVMASQTDVPVYVMLAPTAAGVYAASLPQYVQKYNQKELIDRIYLDLDKDVGTIDAFYPLYSARNEYIYYRTENLWTSFGAYYAYAEAIRQLGAEPQTMENYDQEFVLSSFTGSLYEKAMYGGISPDRINLFRSKYQSSVSKVVLESDGCRISGKSVYFRSALNSSKKTDVFLLGDQYDKITVTSESDSGQKLLIIKGSYANTLVPFLTPHYSQITLVDPQSLARKGETLSDVVDTEDYDQILVMFDIDSFSNADYLSILSDKG